MDEKDITGQPKQDQPVSEPAQQHVHIFGAEINGDGGTAGTQTDRAERKEEWRKHKEDWKAERRAQRDQWRVQRADWRHHHGHGAGGIFWGLVVLCAGVIALLYTMGLISPVFWQVIEPFWPVLLILWGAGMILGRHWFARLILFIIALAFFAGIVFYALVKTDSPVVSSLSSNVAQAIQNMQTHY